MHLLLFHTSLFIILSSTAEAGLAPGAIPANPPAPITKAGADIAQRDVLPTLTLGPASNYQSSPTSSPSLTGSDLSIVPRAKPTDGVDFFFGSDLGTQIASIISNDCPKTNNAKCQTSVAAAINPQEFGLQSRQLGVAIVGLSALMLAVAVWLGRNDNVAPHSNPIHYAHVPQTDFNHVASIGNASTVVFATGSDDANRVTITQSSTKTSSSGAVVTTAQADGNGYKKNDVVISLDQNLGQRVHDYISQLGCNRYQTGLECVDTIAGSVMQQAVPGGPFRELAQFPIILPGLGPNELAQALTRLIWVAQKDIPKLALVDPGINFLAGVCFWIVYDQIVQKSPTINQHVIPASVTATSTSPSASATCPPDDRQPNCSNCGGTPDNDSKKSGICPGPKWKGCPCVDGPSYPYKPFANAKDHHDAQAALLNLPFMSNADAMGKVAADAIADATPHSSLSCIPPSSAPTGVPQDQVKDKITNFCGGFSHMFQGKPQCDSQVNDGFYQSKYCNPDTGRLRSYAFPYGYPDLSVEMVLNASLTVGTSGFLTDEKICLDTLNTVLNNCPKDGTTKRGGVLAANDGNNNWANFKIIFYQSQTKLGRR